MGGRWFRISLIFLVFAGVAVRVSYSRHMNGNLHEYCLRFMDRHHECYSALFLRWGENRYICEICAGLRSHGFEDPYNYDADYYDNIMTWGRNLHSKQVEKDPTIDPKTIADVEEKTLHTKMVKSYSRFLTPGNLNEKEAKDTTLNGISTKSEGSSPVTDGEILETNTKTEKSTERNENKEPPGTIEPGSVFTGKPIIKVTEERNKSKLVPALGKSTKGEIAKTEETTPNSKFVSDEPIKAITTIKSEEELGSRPAENSTYGIKETTTELINETKVEVIGLKEVTLEKLEGTTQNKQVEEKITQSTEPNNEIKNITSDSETGTAEPITVSRESNSTTEETGEIINTRLDTTKLDDLKNDTKESTVQALVTNVTAEDEPLIFVNSTTEAEEKATAIPKNSTTEKEAIRSRETTKELEITTGVREETKPTENTPEGEEEITTMGYSRKEEIYGISNTVSVEISSATDIKHDYFKILKSVVSGIFLAIGLIATVILTTYMIKARRRTVAYDQLKLLP